MEFIPSKISELNNAKVIHKPSLSQKVAETQGMVLLLKVFSIQLYGTSYPLGLEPEENKEKFLSPLYPFHYLSTTSQDMEF